MIKNYFFLLIPALGFSQVQIGQDINGLGNWSNTSLSSNGATVALGALNQSQSKVYKESSGAWVQVGQDIPARGYSVSLSSLGNIVALGDNLNNNNNGVGAGSVSVYEFDQGTWKQKGQSIKGKSAAEQNGFSISLSSNGNTVAIGAPYKAWQGNSNSPQGTVRVYNYNTVSRDWNQVGQDIDGNGWGYFSGTSVSLSADGNVLAVDSMFESTTGVVRVYRNVNGVWTQIGNTIHGEANSDRFGRSTSLSADGTIIAIGGYRNSANGISRGHVRVYKNVSGVWTQVGSDIDGQANHEQVGFSVSLSSDGSIVALGALMEATAPLTGRTRIYKNISNVWTKVYNDIGFGNYVSLSADAKRIAVKKNGITKIFDLGTASNNSFSNEAFNIFPNPAIDFLNISLDNDQILEKVIIYNNLGQIVKTSNHKVVNVESLSPGIYFVEVATNHGKGVKKLIVK